MEDKVRCWNCGRKILGTAITCSVCGKLICRHCIRHKKEGLICPKCLMDLDRKK